MRKRRDLDAWYKELVERDPAAVRAVAADFARTPVARKLALLCDECLDEGFVAWLREQRRQFKVFTLPRGRSDEHLWQEARQRGRLLVTADRDFLDDRRYPLHVSPGVLFLDANSTDGFIQAFVRHFVASDSLRLFAHAGWTAFTGMKASASADHTEFRSHNADDGSVLVWGV